MQKFLHVNRPEDLQNLRDGNYYQLFSLIEMKRPPKRDSENLAEYRYCCDEERVQQQELEAHWGGETKEFIRNKAVEHFVLPEVQVIPEPDRIEEVKKPSLVSEVDY